MPFTKDIVDQTLRTPYAEKAFKIVEILTDAGHEAWWVGGAVRDMLQGHVPDDIDIATSAHPDDVMKIFRKSYDASEKLGSVRIPIGYDAFEVTTFREDDEASDGRHPQSVVFGTREEDGQRRDFTINALYFHPISRELYDPFHGEADLKEKLIRFIGEPAIRIKHDALRILRAVRFRALVDGQYHPETFAALQEHAGLVKILSGSRQLEEFEKMLLGPHPDRALEDLWELRILHEFLPELAINKGIPQPADYHHEGDVWEHILRIARSFHDEHGIDVRIAAIFHDIGKAKTFSLKERIRFDHHATVSADLSKAILDRLQCSSKRRDKIVWIIEHHMMMGSFASMNDERKAHWYYHPCFPELLELMELDIAGTDPADYSLLDSIRNDYHRFLDSHPRPLKSLLSGDEVMEMLGLQPGEKVGEVLQKLHEAQMSGTITTKKEARTFLASLRD